MDKRHFISLGILFGMILIAWAIGPSNYMPVTESVVSKAEQEQDNRNLEVAAAQKDTFQSEGYGALESGILVSGQDSESRIPKALYDGTWSGNASGGGKKPESGNPQKSNGDRTASTPIMLGSYDSTSGRSTNPKARLQFPQDSTLDGNNRGPRTVGANRIPGREDQKKSGPASIVKTVKPSSSSKLMPLAKTTDASRNSHQPAIGSTGRNTNSKKSPGFSSAANLDLQALSKQLKPIRKGSLPARNIAANWSSSSRNASIDSDPLFKPIISPSQNLAKGPASGQHKGTSTNQVDIGQVRGLPFAMAGHRRNSQLSAAGGKIGIPGTKQSKPIVPQNLTPKYQQEYIWHVLSSHETLESIANAYDGGPSMVRKLVEINKDVIQDPKLLPVGKAIRIPIP